MRGDSTPAADLPRRGHALCSSALLAALLLAACGGAEAPPDAPGEIPRTPQPSAVVELPGSRACEGLEHRILSVPPLRASLASAFGPPDSATVVTRPNLHQRGVTDTVFTVHHSGLRVSGVQPTGGREVPGHLEVLENRYLASPHLGIGAEASAIVEAHGAPAERRPQALVYDCGEVEQPVTFWLEDGRVTRITVEFHVD